MKNILATFLLLITIAVAGQSSAHHAAAGIVSDEIWQMIDDLLVAADSPHLDLDFVMMESTIVTSIEVETTMVDDILANVSSVNNGRLVIATQAIDADMTEIIIVEPVGAGESQIVYQ